jgi:ferrous iron transport protein A
MTTLAQLPLHHLARVCHLRVEPELAQRLTALGLRPDREVEVIRRGWLSGPLLIRAGTTEFMMRRDAADLIDVEPLDC